MKNLLLVIDIQNEYITPERPFHISGIGPSLANAKQVLDAARNSGTPVWHIQHLQEKNVFIKGTPLAEIVADFTPLKNEPVFIKDLYSSFSSPEFKKAILESKPEEILVIGYGSSVCCLCTIIDGVHRGLSFTLIEDYWECDSRTQSRRSSQLGFC